MFLRKPSNGISNSLIVLETKKIDKISNTMEIIINIKNTITRLLVISLFESIMLCFLSFPFYLFTLKDYFKNLVFPNKAIEDAIK